MYNKWGIFEPYPLMEFFSIISKQISNYERSTKIRRVREPKKIMTKRIYHHPIMSLTHICKADELNISTMSINFWQLNKYFRCLFLNCLRISHTRIHQVTSRTISKTFPHCCNVLDRVTHPEAYYNSLRNFGQKAVRRLEQDYLTKCEKKSRNFASTFRMNNDELWDNKLYFPNQSS